MSLFFTVKYSLSVCEVKYARVKDASSANFLRVTCGVGYFQVRGEHEECLLQGRQTQYPGLTRTLAYKRSRRTGRRLRREFVGP